jgi:hypothetical protein
MKKILFITLLVFISNFAFAQKTITTDCTEKYSCSQKYGLTPTKIDYKLKVKFDEKELNFNTNGTDEFSPYSTYFIAKKTEKYVIGKNKEGNYAFYNIAKKQFYYIDYYMKRYLTAGLGSENVEIKQNTLKIMSILKKGNSQKDAVQFLIKQTEYDF